MEQKSTSIWKSSIISGIYVGIALILVSVVFYVTGNTFSKSAQWIGYGVMLIGIVMAQLSYRKSLGGFMTYSQALGLGVLTMLFASLLSGIYNLLLYEVIDPSLKEQMRLFTEEQMLKQGLSEEQMNAALQVSSKMQSPVMMFVMAIVGGTFIGLIMALITSIFTKKNPTEDVVE